MSKQTHDVIVIGGGPAGMIAAGRAAELGAKVLLLEKNDRLGRKLKLTGNGRCNITKILPTAHDLVEAFGPNGRFLHSALSHFGIPETVEYFRERNINIVVEADNRAFPESQSAIAVIEGLTEYLKDLQVEILINCTVEKLNVQDDKIISIATNKGEFIASNYILTTGGLSFPSTGSSGDGLRWAKELGHTVAATRPALTPLVTNETWIEQLQGVSLKNAHLGVYLGDKRVEERVGDLMFTHYGLSGPVILDISLLVGELLLKGSVRIKIDLKPQLDLGKVDAELVERFNAGPNQQVKTALESLLPRKLVPIILWQSMIDPFKLVNTITKEARHFIAEHIKGLSLQITELIGYEQAMVTAGGVALNEIEAKTMRSRIIGNLYFAGEILDLAGPSGGYNLQMCWTTGFVAGESVVV